MPILRMWEQLFAPLPCRLIPLELPARLREAENEMPVDLPRICAKIVETQAHCGFLVDGTGQQLRLIDECGRLIPLSEWFRLVVALFRAEFPELAVLQPKPRESTPDESMPVAEWVEARAVSIGLDDAGRIWYGRELMEAESETLACDALLTAAALLQQFSRTDAGVSDVLVSHPQERNNASR